MQVLKKLMRTQCCQMAKQEGYHYSVPERIFLVKNFYILHADYETLFVDFTVSFPVAPCPTRGYIHKLHTKFERTGSVLDAKHLCWPRTIHRPEDYVATHDGLLKCIEQGGEHLLSFFYY